MNIDSNTETGNFPKSIRILMPDSPVLRIRTDSGSIPPLEWTSLKFTWQHRNNGPVKVPDRPNKKWKGFSYTGSNFFDFLPEEIRLAKTSSQFKSRLKTWIWENIPSTWVHKSRLLQWHCWLNPFIQAPCVAFRMIANIQYNTIQTFLESGGNFQTSE